MENELAVRQDASIEPRGNVAGDMAISRVAQEVQAAMMIARRFPRDETSAHVRIMRACKRKALAEVACYAYPRGGTTVTGPSIRLAEAMAQNWGNLDFGIVEVEQRNGESTVMSYAWDLETNTRQTKIFQVKHERKARGAIQRLDDPRDIYELVANQGARRLRACILGIIPGDITDAAVEACEKTLATETTEPIEARIRKMADAFGEMQVTLDMLEKRLGHKITVTTEQELVGLRKIYVSLRDGMSGRDAWFGSTVPERGTVDLNAIKPSAAAHTGPGEVQPVAGKEQKASGKQTGKKPRTRKGSTQQDAQQQPVVAPPPSVTQPKENVSQEKQPFTRNEVLAGYAHKAANTADAAKLGELCASAWAELSADEHKSVLRSCDMEKYEELVDAPALGLRNFIRECAVIAGEA